MKKPRAPAVNGTSCLDVASPGVNFLTKSDKAVLIMTGPPTDVIHGVNRLTRTSCPLSPCLSALFKKISTPSDRHRGMTFRSPWALVGFTATLRYETCIQFINVSQRTLHIYWQFSAMSHAIHKIVSKRRCQSYFISRHSPHRHK